jgi:hypothetical protein
MPDNVATASLTTDNGGMLFGSNFRFKTDTGSSGSESPISPFKIANNILDGFDVGFDWVLKPLLIKNVIIDGQTAFRYLSVGGKVFNESYDLFKFFDKAGLAASNINNRVVGPFITGYHAAEMVDMIRQGRQDDAFTAASHMVGPWVFGWDFVTENYDPPQRHNFGGSSRFENSSISSPWQRSEFSSQSLMRELGGNQVSGDYLPPGT